MKKYSVFDSSDKVCYHLYIIIFSGGTEMSDFDLSDIEEMQVSLGLKEGDNSWKRLLIPHKPTTRHREEGKGAIRFEMASRPIS